MPKIYVPRYQVLSTERRAFSDQGGGVRIRPQGSGGGCLLQAATAALGGVQPLHYWDFTTDRALFNGQDVGVLSNTPGWSFTRATVGSALTAAGVVTQFASGQLRRTNRGALIEGARTNLFLNSATGGTQLVTVAAVSHVLSFRGTGTIALTGASVAGPLVGTGVNNLVTLVFTPSAGVLTLTVTGSCTNVQLEEGAFETSWIPTTGAPVTRNLDLLNVASPRVAYPLGLFADIDRSSDSGIGSVFFEVDNNTNDERSALVVNAGDLPTVTMVDNAVVQAAISIGAALPLATPAKYAGRFATNNVQGARGGVLGTAVTTATLPVTPTFIRFGEIASTGVPCFGYIRRAAVFNSAVTDAQLQAMTA